MEVEWRQRCYAKYLASKLLGNRSGLARVNASSSLGEGPFSFATEGRDAIGRIWKLKRIK